MLWTNDHIVLYATTFLLSGMFIYVFHKLAFRFDFAIDRPDWRKQHEGSTAAIGGLGIFAAFILSGFLFDEKTLQDHWPLLTGTVLLLVVGAVDDGVHLSARFKLLVQITAACIMIFAGGVEIKSLGDLLGAGPIKLGYLSIPVTIIVVVGFINVVNMVDGIDGLCGGICLVFMGWLAAAAYLGEQFETAQVLLHLFSAVLAFQLLNMRSPLREKAYVFLGDAGSTALAYVIAWYTIDLNLSPKDGVGISPVGFAWILALPVIDGVSLSVHRVRMGYSPFHPDRSHLHHFFLRAGVPDGRAAVTLIFVTFLMGAFGFYGSYYGLPDFVLGVALVCMIVWHYYLVRHSKSFLWFLRETLARGEHHRPHHHR